VARLGDQSGNYRLDDNEGAKNENCVAALIYDGKSHSESPDGGPRGSIHDSKLSAERSALSGVKRLACIEIDCFEGDGL